MNSTQNTLSQPSIQTTPLIDFKIHTISSAPQVSQSLLQDAMNSYGMIPNLHGIMAESPQTYQAYMTLTHLVMGASFTPVERHVLWLAINVENQCHYCVPAHTMLAHKEGVEPAMIDALLNGQVLSDVRLETLRQFSLEMLLRRGQPNSETVTAFFEAGFTQRQALEVVLVISHKVLSNYINALANTDVDAPFEKYAWTPH